MQLAREERFLAFVMRLQECREGGELLRAPRDVVERRLLLAGELHELPPSRAQFLARVARRHQHFHRADLARELLAEMHESISHGRVGRGRAGAGLRSGKCHGVVNFTPWHCLANCGSRYSRMKRPPSTRTRSPTRSAPGAPCVDEASRPSRHLTATPCCACAVWRFSTSMPTPAPSNSTATATAMSR